MLLMEKNTLGLEHGKRAQVLAPSYDDLTGGHFDFAKSVEAAGGNILNGWQFRYIKLLAPETKLMASNLPYCIKDVRPLSVSLSLPLHLGCGHESLPLWLLWDGRLHMQRTRRSRLSKETQRTVAGPDRSSG